MKRSLLSVVMGIVGYPLPAQPEARLNEVVKDEMEALRLQGEKEDEERFDEYQRQMNASAKNQETSSKPINFRKRLQHEESYLDNSPRKSVQHLRRISNNIGMVSLDFGTVKVNKRNR